MKSVAVFVLLTAVAAAEARPAFQITAIFGFGDTEGQPFVTSDASGFFVHTLQDFGDGTPNPLRPLSSALGTNPDLEWTTYLTADALGPTRLSGSTNNQSDQFYLSRGVYSAGFATRSATLMTLTPGVASLPGSAARRTAIVAAGELWGGVFAAAPLFSSGISPEGPSFEGAFFARLTVKRGVTINGQPHVSFRTTDGVNRALDLVLDGPAMFLDGPVSYAVRSYLVAQVDITDDGFDFDGNPYGAADVYDVWLTQVPRIPMPAASLAFIFGTVGCYPRRRR